MTETPNAALIAQLRECANMMPEGGTSDPIIDCLASLANEAADALSSVRSAAIEECAKVAGRHDGMPLKPAYPNAWTEEQRHWYDSGQIDASVSIEDAIRALDTLRKI